MNPKVLEYFVRVAECGSINKAAPELNLSQPALSRHISALEHELRVKLLNRAPRGVRLTEAGKHLLERARPLLREMAMLSEELSQEVAGKAMLGMPPSWQRLITAPLVKRLSGELPDLRVRVYEGINNVLRDYMAAGLIDVGVVAYNVPPVPRFSRLPLLREPLLLVGGKSADLNRAEPVSLLRVAREKIVLPGHPNVIRRHIENVLRRHGYPFNIVVEAETLALCLELTRQGVACTVMPYCALHEHPQGGEFTWAPIRKLELTWVLVQNESRVYSPAVREVRRLLIDEVRERLAGQRWPGATRMRATAGRH